MVARLLVLREPVALACIVILFVADRTTWLPRSMLVFATAILLALSVPLLVRRLLQAARWFASDDFEAEVWEQQHVRDIRRR
jgi:hypothetical protein